MKAVQREDFDGLAKLLIKAGHLFNLLWVRHKAGVQLLIASVNIGDHQHHELHRSSPWFLFWSCTPSRLAAPKFDTHPNYFFRAPGAAVLIPPLRFLLAHTQGFSIGCLGLRRLSETHSYCVDHQISVIEEGV